MNDDERCWCGSALTPEGKCVEDEARLAILVDLMDKHLTHLREKLEAQA
jgi:hypothetical protein